MNATARLDAGYRFDPADSGPDPQSLPSVLRIPARCAGPAQGEHGVLRGVTLCRRARGDHEPRGLRPGQLRPQHPAVLRPGLRRHGALVVPLAVRSLRDAGSARAHAIAQAGGFRADAEARRGDAAADPADRRRPDRRDGGEARHRAALGFRLPAADAGHVRHARSRGRRAFAGEPGATHARRRGIVHRVRDACAGARAAGPGRRADGLPQRLLRPHLRPQARRAERRPDQRAGRGPRRGRLDAQQGRGRQRHRGDVRRRLRDHGAPDRQRHAHAAPRAGTVAGIGRATRRAGAAYRRRSAAFRVLAAGHLPHGVATGHRRRLRRAPGRARAVPAGRGQSRPGRVRAGRDHGHHAQGLTDAVVRRRHPSLHRAAARAAGRPRGFRLACCPAAAPRRSTSSTRRGARASCSAA